MMSIKLLYSYHGLSDSWLQNVKSLLSTAMVVEWGLTTSRKTLISPLAAISSRFGVLGR